MGKDRQRHTHTLQHHTQIHTLIQAAASSLNGSRCLRISWGLGFHFFFFLFGSEEDGEIPNVKVCFLFLSSVHKSTPPVSHTLTHTHTHRNFWQRQFLKRQIDCTSKKNLVPLCCQFALSTLQKPVRIIVIKWMSHL